MPFSHPGKPPAGNQPSHVEKNRMKMRPIQKFGTATPSWLNTRTARSTALSRRPRRRPRAAVPAGSR